MTTGEPTHDDHAAQAATYLTQADRIAARYRLDRLSLNTLAALAAAHYTAACHQLLTSWPAILDDVTKIDRHVTRLADTVGIPHRTADEQPNGGGNNTTGWQPQQHLTRQPDNEQQPHDQ